MTARSFIWEKVALAASGAWVGTTAAWVICSIMTFLAARLPNGRGVGSTTTGAGVAARLALEGLGAGAATGAALVTGGITLGAAALATGWILVLAAWAAGWVVLEGTGFLADAFGTGRGTLFLTAGRAAGLTATFLATGLGAGLLAAGFTAAFTGAFLTDALAAGFAVTLDLVAALAGGFDLAADLVVAVLLATGARDLAPDAAGLPDFAVLVAGAFTTVSSVYLTMRDLGPGRR